MGRTVTSLLIVAAAIAVNVIPGVGQAISATLISAGLTTAAATALSTALIAAVTAAGIQSAAMLLGLGPKLPKPETTEGAVKTPIPHRVSAYGRRRLYGAYTLFETSTEGDAYDAFAIHDGRVDAIEERYLGDDKITLSGNQVNPGSDGRFDDHVYWYETLGTTPGNANFAQFVAALPGIWTNDHRGDGVCVVGTRWRTDGQEDFPTTFPMGGPVAASIVARWQRVFDPRDGTQSVANPDSWKWSENALLHLLHYRLVREKARSDPGQALPSGAALQAAWDLYFAPTLALWVEAADVCDENVALNAGGTEKRYRSCFSHRHTDAHKDVIDALTACFDGWTSSRSDGALVVYAGKYYEPTVEIGPDEIVSYSWQNGVEDESAVNEITLSYVSAPHDYNTVECTPWRDTDDMAERGAVRSQPLELQIPSHGQARRLAKRTMARVMAPSRGTVTTTVAGRIARGQRFIHLRIEEGGAVFFDGVAEITQLTRNLSTGGVTFVWFAADANVDAWNPATEEGDPAAVGSRVAPQPLVTPTVDDATVIYVNSAQEGTGARIQVDASGPGARTDLTWYLRWRVDGAAIWNEQRYPDIAPGVAVQLLSGLVPVGEDIEVAVAYRVGDGRVSDYSPAVVVTTDTETTVPPAATAITLVEWGAALHLSTPAIPRASSYRWRFYASDGVTLIRTITTTGREVEYLKDLAAVDGARRAYKADVAGVNAAGAGGAFMSDLLEKPAPAAPTALAIPDDTDTAAASFTPPAGEIAGYVLYYSTAAAFDPLTAGIAVYGGGSPIYAYGLGAATYYGKVAAYDEWTNRPDLLNFSAEDSFTITAGGGSIGGGGTGGGGGGYPGGGGWPS